MSVRRRMSICEHFGVLTFRMPTFPLPLLVMLRTAGTDFRHRSKFIFPQTLTTARRRRRATLRLEMAQGIEFGEGRRNLRAQLSRSASSYLHSSFNMRRRKRMVLDYAVRIFDCTCLCVVIFCCAEPAIYVGAAVPFFTLSCP